MTYVSILDSLFSFIEENMQLPLNLEMLAEASGLSVFQLIRLFDRFAGMPPKAYVRARRLARSIPQLLNGGSVLSVALDWGFEYEQSYIRAFREAYGITPARFRRQREAVRITGIPNLSGLTVSASGMLGQPALLIRPAFQLTGQEVEYNYQANLLYGKPLLDGLSTCRLPVYSAACRLSKEGHFTHKYLIVREADLSGTVPWSYRAGQWAHFVYSGMHPLDEQGASRYRLLASLVVNSWFADNASFWDGSFIETVTPANCAEDYCEVALSCFVGAV